MEELRAHNYDVIHKYDVDEAFEYITRTHKEIELLVLDMMMPSGEIFKHKDLEKGRRTGHLFVEEIQANIGKINFPLIIFTHVNTDNLSDEYSSFKFQKEEFTPAEFAQEIEEIIGRNKNT
jgi:CheY-like chemotaxis protein